jgi:hypothetical protein
MFPNRFQLSQHRGVTLAILLFPTVMGIFSLSRASEPGNDRSPRDLPPGGMYVDGVRGSDTAFGDSKRPLKSISAAVALLPDPLTRSVDIYWLGGEYRGTGSRDMPSSTLELMRRMRPEAKVRIIGRPDESGNLPVMAWEGGPAMVDVREGHWALENVQVGSGSTRQRRGVMVTGPGHVTLKDIKFRTRSLSDAGIFAQRGGKVSLRGAIKLNEHLHDKADAETFAGIIVEDRGSVQFVERAGASLDMGNGSLSASYYGVIRLGCETARITSWGEQSNNLAINNGGRIDLHGTTTTLCARQRENTPIGLEHDGHILAEGARIVIEGENNAAIVLQKASTLACNDIELRGAFKTAVAAMSGSMFVGRFLGDIPGLSANTSASIHIDQLQKNGRVLGPVSARRGAVISLPDRTVMSE